MTISSVEDFMGDPIDYRYVNDSTETRTYVYDHPESGLDRRIKVTYENLMSISIEDYW